MKNQIIFAIIISISLSSFAENIKKIETKLSSVTVYRKGAEIIRSAKAKVTSGTSTIIFKGLSHKILQKSIQLSSSSNVVILSVEYGLNYLSGKERSKNYIRIEDSLEIVKMAISRISNQKLVLKSEEDLLIANRKIGGEQTGVSVAELERAIAFFRSNMERIKSELLTIITKEKKLIELRKKLQSQLNQLNEKSNTPTGEVKAHLLVKSTSTADFKLTYLINDAGWTPMYDLRADDIKSPVKVTYKANVYQNTGVNWDQVNMTVSTGNPTQSSTKPVLYPWFIDFIVINQQYRNINAPAAFDKLNKAGVKPLLETKMEDASVGGYTSVTEAQLSTFFEIDIPYTIPSDGKPHMVAMKDYKLPAVFKYYAAPKIDKDAFLLARVTNWEKLSLLPGQANIFFNGGYVGQSYIDPRTAINDTLDFSLGRDKKIIIKREKIIDFTKQKVVGANKKETLAYEITIRNTKKEAINIILFDQFPISKNKDIQVTLDESSDGVVNAEKGALLWNLQLQSGDRKKLKLIYSVKYPKNKIINL